MACTTKTPVCTTETPVCTTENSVYTTDLPLLYGKFCSEVDQREVNEALRLYENCHGKKPRIKVIFFIIENCSTNGNGSTNRVATPNDTTYGNVLGYNFSDYAVNKYDTERQLIVRVSPATL